MMEKKKGLYLLHKSLDISWNRVSMSYKYYYILNDVSTRVIFRNFTDIFVYDSWNCACPDDVCKFSRF